MYDYLYALFGNISECLLWLGMKRRKSTMFVKNCSRIRTQTLQSLCTLMNLKEL